MLYYTRQLALAPSVVTFVALVAGNMPAECGVGSMATGAAKAAALRHVDYTWMNSIGIATW